MRAWTFTEPWATLIVTGEKKWETRSRPNYKVVGERVAIHAAKGFPRYAQELCTENNFFIAALARHEVNHNAFDLGCVIGFAKVNSCLHVEKVRNFLTEQEKAFGDYSDGRFCFHLIDPEMIEPIPAKGALGIWQWDGKGYHHAGVDLLDQDYPSMQLGRLKMTDLL